VFSRADQIAVDFTIALRLAGVELPNATIAIEKRPALHFPPSAARSVRVVVLFSFL